MEDYRKFVDSQYRSLLEQCKIHLDQLERGYPEPREDFHALLKERGVSRRDFLKWTGLMTTVLMLPPMFKPMVARAAENFSRIPIIWLHFAECTGCSEAILRSSYPNVDDILLETISLEYHETLMAAAGYQAEKCLEDAMEHFAGKYVCVIEGAIPRGMKGQYLRLGPKGETALEMGKKVVSKAAMTISLGACAVWGGLPAASPNPTDAVGASKAFGISTVNIAGCPPNAVNFTGTLLHFIMFGTMPPLDGEGRPLWAYGKRVHDFCERRPHYDAGEFVEQWGDEGAKKGWCLYKMGCKGPYTFANCPHLRFNDHMSWPVMAGHGCIGCTERGFWDTMAPYEKPIQEAVIGGGERTIDNIGIILTAATAAGVAAHGVYTAIRRKGVSEVEEEHKQEEGK